VQRDEPYVRADVVQNVIGPKGGQHSPEILQFVAATHDTLALGQVGSLELDPPRVEMGEIKDLR
jgi:hypothetical protein